VYVYGIRKVQRLKENGVQHSRVVDLTFTIALGGPNHQAHQPPYSSDHPSCGSSMFGSPKHRLGDHHFRNNEEVEVAVHKWL
jgi:hypothetical protein